MKRYFESPTMVLFFDDSCIDYAEDTKDLKCEYGIAYKDEVICGCCGSAIGMGEIPYLEELDWLDIRDAICGDIEPVIEDRLLPIKEKLIADYNKEVD